MKHPSLRAMALALVWDWVFGEPPNAVHPVAWFGQFVAAVEKHAPHGQPKAELRFGMRLAVLGVAVAAAPPLLLATASRQRKLGWAADAASLFLLKTTFAGHGLLAAGAAVKQKLQAAEAESAQIALQALVSRDTSTLDSTQLAAATIESLAENTSDSFIAPLFYYTFFGLPGATIYRAINTMDAMVGYRGHYEYLGKIPARLDDLVNLIPARLTALLLLIATFLTGNDLKTAWRVLQTDHGKTASPNAGYPMSTMAGALGVCLTKDDHYCLNATGQAPKPSDLQRAMHLTKVTMLLAAGLQLLFLFLLKRFSLFKPSKT